MANENSFQTAIRKRLTAVTSRLDYICLSDVKYEYNRYSWHSWHGVLYLIHVQRVVTSWVSHTFCDSILLSNYCNSKVRKQPPDRHKFGNVFPLVMNCILSIAHLSYKTGNIKRSWVATDRPLFSSWEKHNFNFILIPPKALPPNFFKSISMSS